MTDEMNYEEYLRSLSYEELLDIKFHIDKEQYPSRYNLLLKIMEENRPALPKEKIQPTVIPESEKYNTFWRRVGAGFVDAIIFYPLTLFGESVIYKSDSIYLIAIWDVLHSWAIVAYSILLHGIYGQTLGKMIFKVKVLDKTEKKLTMHQAVLRDIVLIISNVAFSFWIFQNLEIYSKVATDNIKGIGEFPGWLIVISMMGFIWFILEVITMLGNKKRRALHDFIAGSVVCREIQQFAESRLPPEAKVHHGGSRAG